MPDGEAEGGGLAGRNVDSDGGIRDDVEVSLSFEVPLIDETTLALPSLLEVRGRLRFSKASRATRCRELD